MFFLELTLLGMGDAQSQLGGAACQEMQLAD